MNRAASRALFRLAWPRRARAARRRHPAPPGAIDAAGARTVERYKLPGIAVGVIEDGKVVGGAAMAKPSPAAAIR